MQNFSLSLACHFNFLIPIVFHHNCFSSFQNSHLFYEFWGEKKHCFSCLMYTLYMFYLCQSHDWGYIYVGVCLYMSFFGGGVEIIAWVDFYVLLRWNIIPLTVLIKFCSGKRKVWSEGAFYAISFLCVSFLDLDFSLDNKWCWPQSVSINTTILRTALPSEMHSKKEVLMTPASRR